MKIFEEIQSRLKQLDAGLGIILAALRSILLQLTEFGLYAYGLYSVAHRLMG